MDPGTPFSLDSPLGIGSLEHSSSKDWDGLHGWMCSREGESWWDALSCGREGRWQLFPAGSHGAALSMGSSSSQVRSVGCAQGSSGRGGGWNGSCCQGQGLE